MNAREQALSEIKVRLGQALIKKDPYIWVDLSRRYQDLVDKYDVYDMFSEFTAATESWPTIDIEMYDYWSVRMFPSYYTMVDNIPVRVVSSESFKRKVIVSKTLHEFAVCSVVFR